MEDHSGPLRQDAVERVLRRASEFDGPAAAPGNDRGISEQALIAAAAEVGIPAEAVRRSIAIERLGTPPPGAGADRIVGPAVVVVDVELNVPVGTALGRFDEWLVTGHHLRRESLDSTGGEWRRRTDPMAR